MSTLCDRDEWGRNIAGLSDRTAASEICMRGEGKVSWVFADTEVAFLIWSDGHGGDRAR
jgi:hypothetical protein